MQPGFKMLILFGIKIDDYSAPVELKFSFSGSCKSTILVGEIQSRQLQSSLRTMVAKPLHENSATNPASFYFTVHIFPTFESFLQGYVQAVISLGSPTISKRSVQVLGSPCSLLHTSLEDPILCMEYYNYLKTRRSQDHMIFFPVEFKSKIHKDQLKTFY